ncbi:putative uncharacterized protein DDB_G0284695 [Leptopilina heterotoma]|uniref:putative uncharacterized protein DDB_G0284695 n=1 Tax=Leptopilina heterotoma TaxID=63436 RepID=UPI001CA7E211|nr:putative uncharacterized protein DDB_G0284695 [Leptopilina heterotoma]
MAFLQAIYFFVIVLHNSIYCSRIPLILTARDSLTTEATNLLEIVTPVYNVIHDQEAISTQMPIFFHESNTNPTDKIHFPTEIPLGVKEMTTVPNNAKNKTSETFLNKFGQRLPKFFGRLAFLAGLRQNDEMSNGTSSINFNSAKESSLLLSQNSSPTKLSPYFAAVYEPFPFYPQTYIYSNLLSLIPLLNSQKLPNENNFPFSQQSDNNDDDRMSQGFNFVTENRKNENNTIEERIIEKVPLDKKQKNSIRDKMREITKIQTKEKDEDEEEENEEIEDNEETEEENEEDYEVEEPNVDVFVPPTKTPPVKTNKVSAPSKFSRQKQKTTTKRPTMKKTTMTPMIVTTTEINNNSKNMNNTTQNPVQNNATYLSHPGYYGGYTQNIHDLYFTSSEYPPLHDHFNYNDINQHHSEEWPSNRIPHDSQFYNPYQQVYDHLPHREEEYDSHSFHGSPVPPEALQRGFKPSIQF